MAQTLDEDVNYIAKIAIKNQGSSYLYTPHEKKTFHVSDAYMIWIMYQQKSKMKSGTTNKFEVAFHKATGKELL